MVPSMWQSGCKQRSRPNFILFNFATRFILRFLVNDEGGFFFSFCCFPFRNLFDSRFDSFFLTEIARDYRLSLLMLETRSKEMVGITVDGYDKTTKHLQDLLSRRSLNCIVLESLSYVVNSTIHPAFGFLTIMVCYACFSLLLSRARDSISHFRLETESYLYLYFYYFNVFFLCLFAHRAFLNWQLWKERWGKRSNVPSTYVWTF